MTNKHRSGAPSRKDSLIFGLKVRVLSLRRTFQNFRCGLPKLPLSGGSDLQEKVASSVTRLWTTEKPEEQKLECGKVHNLRIAARLLNGLFIPANSTFSFWRAVGYPSKFKGFVPGRQVQEGCIIPSIGGGLCQLSNAIYEVALSAGLEVVERHPHTVVVPGSAAEFGKDATVAWNHIDLRVRAKSDLRLSVKLTPEALVVELFSSQKQTNSFVPFLKKLPPSRPIANSCETCGDLNCFRHIDEEPVKVSSAWLLDSVWPEFDRYATEVSNSNDRFFIPIGKAFRVPARFQWNVSGRKIQFPIVALRRAMKLRNLSGNGPVRREALLEFEYKLAQAYGQKLNPFDRHVYVDISLLPHLWMSGALGGREFTALVTRWPLSEVHKKFDEASRLNSNAALLSDFRAPAFLVEAEVDALKNARHIVTPHPGIAELFPSRAELIDWDVPVGIPLNGKAIAFLGPTIARKGCYEVRDAFRELNVPIHIGGTNFEGSDFWNGIETLPLGDDWLETVGLIVAPTLMEDQPRGLLLAQSKGISIVTTRESGLTYSENVTFVPFGDTRLLIASVKQCLVAKD